MGEKEDPKDGQGAGQEPGGGSEERTFTQSELDAIISQRLERERSKYEDYDEVKDELEELRRQQKERQEAKMDEREKLESRLSEMEEEKRRIQTQMQDALIRGAVERAATQQGFVDPADAYALVDLGGVSIGDDGDVQGVEEAVEDLADAKPHLLQKREKPPTDGDAGPGNGEEEMEARREEVRRRFGLDSIF